MGWSLFGMVIIALLILTGKVEFDPVLKGSDIIAILVGGSVWMAIRLVTRRGWKFWHREGR